MKLRKRTLGLLAAALCLANPVFNLQAGEMAGGNIQAALDVNPNLGNLQFFKLSDFLQYGQLDQARDYARQMNSKTLNVDDVLTLIDWVSDSEQEPPPGALAAMQFGAGTALAGGLLAPWRG